MWGIVLSPITMGTAFAVALFLSIRRWPASLTSLAVLAVASAVFVALTTVNYMDGGWALIGQSLLWLIPAEFIWIVVFRVLVAKFVAWSRL
ncbi:hypothetical protein [Bosea minatitlanensis]|uniref:Uncharacterized protein n=1 Tax=Bosea minatitlanensis TaxID=128782 RepID=A0ABW0F1A4_9HYPH|nr:hypothetical protein [Bosea minatitlanensis]MCT4492083.1 hypothetical protein [Bosea minatitlanensis]